eukprot:TRINITY_DN1549_c0_g1_i1.p1 TRINITY_DN1549_c0_g1~~TRINITY_DN1549_c0_g1_i1.p1  ORF type:complete len:667 (+),score=136.52 TRINITY_DN1549_c0_g1_i1:192-2192(+)
MPRLAVALPLLLAVVAPVAGQVQYCQGGTLSTRSDETADISCTNGSFVTASSTTGNTFCTAGTVSQASAFSYSVIPVYRLTGDSSSSRVAVRISPSTAFDPTAGDILTYCGTSVANSGECTSTLPSFENENLCGNTTTGTIPASALSGGSLSSMIQLKRTAATGNVGTTSVVCYGSPAAATSAGSNTLNASAIGQGSSCSSLVTADSATQLGFEFQCPTMTSFTTSATQYFVYYEIGGTTYPIMFNCTYQDPPRDKCRKFYWCATPDPNAFSGCNVNTVALNALIVGCSSIPGAIFDCTGRFASGVGCSSTCTANGGGESNDGLIVCAATTVQIESLVTAVQGGSYVEVTTSSSPPPPPPPPPPPVTTRRSLQGLASRVAERSGTVQTTGSARQTCSTGSCGGVPPWTSHCTVTQTGTACSENVQGACSGANVPSTCAATVPFSVLGYPWARSTCIVDDLESTGDFTFGDSTTGDAVQVSIVSGCSATVSRQNTTTGFQATASTNACEGESDMTACCEAFFDWFYCDRGAGEYTPADGAAVWCPVNSSTTFEITCSSSKKGLLGLLGLLALIPLLILLLLCCSLCFMCWKKRKDRDADRELATFDPQPEMCAAPPPPVYTDHHHHHQEPHHHHQEHHHHNDGYSDYHGSHAEGSAPPPPPTSSYPY